MFWSRFELECKRIGKKPNPIAQELGIPSGSITSWKNGSTPKSATLEKLAAYFGCTTDYLLGISDNRNAATRQIIENLTPQETELLTLFRDTTEKGRLEMIAACVNIQKEIEKNPVTGIEGDKVG